MPDAKPARLSQVAFDEEFTAHIRLRHWFTDFSVNTEISVNRTDFSLWPSASFARMGRCRANALQQILMTASREHSERTVLRIIVEGLVEQPHVALARIWLLRPGDICATCRMRPECPDQSRCLHLAASSGRSLAEPGADWTRIDGDFRRFPVGVRKVGQIAATGIPVFVANTAEQSEWIARPQWAACERIRSFAGQPLVFGSETLGVIAVFSRVELGEIDFRWLRLFADHAAITLVNAVRF